MPTLSQWMIRIALGYLMIGFSLGFSLLVSKVGWISSGIWRWHPVHMECLMSGWMYHLVLGVAYWMFPRLSGGLRPRKILVFLSICLFNLGLFVYSGGVLWEQSIAVITGRLFELVALILFVLHLLPRVKAFGTSGHESVKSPKK